MTPASTGHFDPEDPSYYLRCCCCCNIHVSTLAHLIAVMWILTDIVFLAFAISTGRAEFLAIVTYFVISIMLWYGPIHENRSAIGSLLVVLGGCTVILVVFDVLLLCAVGSGELSLEVFSTTLARTALLSAVIGIWLWCFYVWWRFYQFLGDEKAADEDATVLLEAARGTRRHNRLEITRSTPLMAKTAHSRHYGNGRDIEGRGGGLSRSSSMKCQCCPPKYEEPPPTYAQARRSSMEIDAR